MIKNEKKKKKKKKNCIPIGLEDSMKKKSMKPISYFLSRVFESKKEKEVPVMLLRSNEEGWGR